MTTDDELNRAIAQGQENAQVIALANNHCQHMEFVVTGGYGMAEEMSGLPINMRRIRCVKAHGTIGSFQLRHIATNFYEEHCVGCELRKPSGNLPTLGTMVEDDRQVEAFASARAAEREAELTRERSERSRKRQAMQVTADPAMAGVLRDLDVIDSFPAAEREHINAAMQRLTALVQKVPHSFTDSVVREVLLLARHYAPLLGPIRVLCRRREGWRSAAVDAALDVLRGWGSPDAARILVQFPDVAPSTCFDATRVRSLLGAAYGPDNDDMGFRRARSSTDPAVLQLLLQRARQVLIDELEEMLPGRAQRSQLALPARAATMQARSEAERESDRATAAAAVHQLLMNNDEVGALLVPALLRNSVAEGDQYERFAHAAVQRATALAILTVDNAEQQWWAAGRNASDEDRESLFEVWGHLSELTSAEAGWDSSSPDLTDEERHTLRGRVFDAAMRLSDGQWGHGVAGTAADIVVRLAQSDSKWAATHTDAFLGGFLAALRAAHQSERQVLQTPGEPSDYLAAMERAGRAMVLRSAASRFLDAATHASGAAPRRVVEAILAFLEAAPDDDEGVDLRWRLIPVLGEIGRRSGDEPGVLGLIVPTLYSNLLSSKPQLVERAIQSWGDIAFRHPLPSLFEDLLSVLLDNTYSVVIEALLKTLPRLDLNDDHYAATLHYALRWLRSSKASGPNEDLFRPALACSARLVQSRPGDWLTIERILLGRLRELSGYDLRDLLRLNWSKNARRSTEFARATLAAATDPVLGSPHGARDSDHVLDLLDTGAGLSGLELTELRDAALSFGPERVFRGLEIVEVTWRAARLDDALAIAEALLSSIPITPAFAPQRAAVTRVASALNSEEPLSVSGHKPQLDDATSESSGVAEQVRIRSSLRSLLSNPGSDPGELMSCASVLQDEAKALAVTAQRDTPTAAYIRHFAKLCGVAGHIFLLEAAELEGDSRRAKARRRAILRLAGALRADLIGTYEEDDPLGQPIRKSIARLLDGEGGDEFEFIEGLASMTLPLLFVEGRDAPARFTGGTAVQAKPTPAVAVVMISVDDRLLTGPAVLRPDTVYTVKVDLQIDAWPDWADQLHLGWVGGFVPTEMMLPEMTWQRPASFDGTLSNEGTLLLRFALPAGRPAPPFSVMASWSGEIEGQARRERIDVAGHSEIRLRPFDAARDALTDIDVVDERLHKLYASLFAADYPDEEIQAFCRLFTAVCRSGFRYTWDKKYRRGARVTERQFHDDLYDDLMADPDLGGRVERGSPLALGFLDIRHDRITAELKVERRVAVTHESAPKYMGQATQYASADGRHLSILAILDMSPKERPPGTAENNLFMLIPALHGLNDPYAPSVVAVVVVNGNLPVPSSWSRRKPSALPAKAGRRVGE